MQGRELVIKREDFIYEYYRNWWRWLHWQQLYLSYAGKNPDCRIICLDKLPYADKRSTLAPVMNNKSFRFVKADICDRLVVNKLCEEMVEGDNVKPRQAFAHGGVS